MWYKPPYRSRVHHCSDLSLMITTVFIPFLSCCTFSFMIKNIQFQTPCCKCNPTDLLLNVAASSVLDHTEILTYIFCLDRIHNYWLETWGISFSPAWTQTWLLYYWLTHRVMFSLCPPNLIHTNYWDIAYCVGLSQINDCGRQQMHEILTINKQTTTSSFICFHFHSLKLV